jgi:hypothetical protein
MREAFIQYLNTRQANDLARFLRLWIAHKMPQKTENEVIGFIQEYINHLMHVPVMFDGRYQQALQSLIEVARVELEVNSVVHNNDYNKVIKYY